MTKKELAQFEEKLVAAGYKKITSAKATPDDEYEYYKAFYEKEDSAIYEERPKYQIFFEIWDFEKYRYLAGYSVSSVIIPDSITEDAGRRDLHLSVDWNDDIEKTEAMAEQFYNFLINFEKTH